MVAAGAAELRVQEPDERMGELLLSDLVRLLSDTERRAEISRKVRALAHPEALKEIGRLVAKVAGWQLGV